jgi:hypothetical protein
VNNDSFQSVDQRGAASRPFAYAEQNMVEVEDMVDNKPDANSSETTSAARREPKTSRFDLSRLRLDQTFDAGKTTKTLGNIKIQKPDKFTWFRVHGAWELTTNVLDLKEERETYLVVPELLADLALEVSPRMIVPCVTRQNDVFFWPLRIPDSSGREDSWMRSALEACELGKQGWIRIVSNLRTAGYDVHHPAVQPPTPKWPDLTFEAMVEKAFKNFLIDDSNHPRLRMLRGEV